MSSVVDQLLTDADLATTMYQRHTQAMYTCQVHELIYQDSEGRPADVDANVS